MRAGNHRNIRGCIGEAVDGIGNQGLASPEIAGRKLDARQRDIYQKSNPGYSANICFARGFRIVFDFLHPNGTFNCKSSFTSNGPDSAR